MVVRGGNCGFDWADTVAGPIVSAPRCSVERYLEKRPVTRCALRCDCLPDHRPRKIFRPEANSFRMPVASGVLVRFRDSCSISESRRGALGLFSRLGRETVGMETSAAAWPFSRDDVPGLAGGLPATCPS